MQELCYILWTQGLCSYSSGGDKMASRLKIKCSVIYAIIDAQYAQIKK